MNVDMGCLVKTVLEDQWLNRDGRVISADYEVFADSSLKHRLLYRFMEATGLSTF